VVEFFVVESDGPELFGVILLLHVRRIKILRASKEKTSLLKVTLQVNTYNPV
jgi:hypothetical protein